MDRVAVHVGLGVIYAATAAATIAVCAAIYFAPLVIEDWRRRGDMAKKGKKGKGGC